MRPSRRFLLRPRWLALHLLALLAVVTMVGLGLWQLRRLDSRRDLNRLLEQRERAAPLSLAELLAQPDGPTSGDAVEAALYRTVVVTGRFRPSDEVLVRSRSFEGAPGAYVLTPLDLGGGVSVVVNRGWVPATGAPALPAGGEAPGGSVTVSGLLLASQTRGSLGPRDPPEGKLATLARLDVDRLRHQSEGMLYPMVLQAATIDPPAGGPYPRLLPPPERSEGPHLSYAGQWFLFSLVALIGYPLLLRRSVRARAGGESPTHNER